MNSPDNRISEEARMVKVYAVLPARNEEQYIENALRSLKAQTLVLMGIIVVDDGSTDRTAEIARTYADIVISLPRHEESYVGRPELARVLNEGLKRVPEDCEYVLIVGADHILPEDYVEKIVHRMREEKVVIASGRIEGEPCDLETPRGSGRVYYYPFFKSIGFFPENWGWESYVVFKALYMGLKVRCYGDIVSKRARPTSRSSRKMYYLGKAMRALGYDWKYAVGRALLNTSPSMLRGYFSRDMEVYRDVAPFVREWQKKYFWQLATSKLVRLRRWK